MNGLSVVRRRLGALSLFLLMPEELLLPGNVLFVHQVIHPRRRAGRTIVELACIHRLVSRHPVGAGLVGTAAVSGGWCVVVGGGGVVFLVLLFLCLSILL